MQVTFHQPEPAHQIPAFNKTLAEIDFFQLLGRELSETDKQAETAHLKRLAFLHFLNIELPALASPADLTILEKMTADINQINLHQVHEFLRQKISDYDELLIKTENKIKVQYLVNHYQKLLKSLHADQKYTGADYLVQILAVERLLKAIKFENWAEVAAIVPQTRTHSPRLQH